MPTMILTWPDEPRAADDDSWAVWETACGTYRIEYDGATDTFTPKYLAVTRIKGGSRERIYEPTGPTHVTFYDALDAVNEYHCRRHGVVLIREVV